MTVVAAFPRREEFERARGLLEGGGVDYSVLSPDPSYSRVGSPSLLVDEAARLLLGARVAEFVCSGWVDYRPAGIAVPAEVPPEFDDDVFGSAAVMVLAPCVADSGKIRLVAHISGDLAEALPYVNAVLPGAFYTPSGQTLTFMEGHRMISLYPRRIAVAKADDLVDGWRVLEAIRCRVNTVWAGRHEIDPSYETRRRPPVIEIYRRLPRTNCGLCGEQACMAFAAQVWQGERQAQDCLPVFAGDHGHLRDALVEICQGLGLAS